MTSYWHRGLLKAEQTPQRDRAVTLFDVFGEQKPIAEHACLRSPLHFNPLRPDLACKVLALRAGLGGCPHSALDSERNDLA